MADSGDVTAPVSGNMDVPGGDCDEPPIDPKGRTRRPFREASPPSGRALYR
jgi:hypothetical protein